MKIVAVDPDVTKSGVAVINVQDKSVETYSLAFPELIEYLYSFKDASVSIAVEAGWLNKPNWHRAPSLAAAANIGNRIGRNHETGRKIVEMCEHAGLPVSLIKPLSKRGQGADKKSTHADLEKALKGRKLILNKKRTNQDERDSILIALYQYDRL